MPLGAEITRSGRTESGLFYDLNSVITYFTLSAASLFAGVLDIPAGYMDRLTFIHR